MNAAGWLFALVSLAVLVCAYFVVSARKLMHAALWLGAVFFGVSIDYLLLNADFLAAAQVLIYIGAIATMIIFGVMLSEPSQLERGGGESFWRSTMRAPIAIAALLAGAAFVALAVILQWRHTWPSPPAGDSGGSIFALGQALFSNDVIPFEVASIILLVALVGAIILSREHAPDEEAKP